MDRPPSSRALLVQVLLAFAAIYFIWGTTFLAIRIGLETLSPFVLGSVRFFIAGGLLFAWTRLRGAALPAAHHWIPAVVAAAFLFLGAQGGVVWAEQRISSGLTAVLITTMPLWMMAITWVRPGGRRPGAVVLVGLCVGFVGVVVLVGPWQAGAWDVDPVGVGVVLVSALCWAVGSLYSREVQGREHDAAWPGHFMVTAMQMLAGGVLLGLAAGVSGEWGRLDLAAVSGESVAAMLYLALAGSLVAFTAYTWLLGVVAPSRVSTYAYVNPIVAVFLGWALADETLTPRMLIATAIILGAVVLVTVGAGRGTGVQRREVDA